jgi:hypothetical protein
MHRYLGAAWAIIMFSVSAVVWMALDRDPPFVSLSYTATNARVGETAMIDAVVVRETWRKCDVEFSRFFIDSAGTRWEVTPYTYITAKGLSSFENRSPERLRLPIQIPMEAAPGPAVFIIPLSYQCNIVHRAFAPIDITLEYKFEVLR